MFVVHGTRKLLERVGPPTPEVPAGSTALGDWYATAFFWRPQVALFVNERTLLPVVVPLAPAREVVARFRAALPGMLLDLGCAEGFVSAEVGQMDEHVLDKTRNRSLIGVMNEFSFLAEVYAAETRSLDLGELSLRLAHTPCGPLFKTFTFPDTALLAVAGEHRHEPRSSQRRVSLRPGTQPGSARPSLARDAEAFVNGLVNGFGRTRRHDGELGLRS